MDVMTFSEKTQETYELKDIIYDEQKTKGGDLTQKRTHTCK